MDDLVQPTPTTPTAPIAPSLLKRLGIAALFALTLGAFAVIAWLAIAFFSMAISKSEAALMVIGYSQIGLIPIGLMAGAVTGAVLGFIQRGKALKRWLLGALLISLMALAINGFFALLL
jgi:hypothetical protein